MERRVSKEQMDDPSVAPDELGRALAFLRLINRWVGGRSAVLRHLGRWLPRGESANPVTLLDLGTGSADLPVAARRWALRRGIDLRILAVDLHETTLDYARCYVERASDPALGGDPRIGAGIELRRGDARAIEAALGARSFDLVHAGLFLHHLATDDVVSVLASMNRLARRGAVWNDLVRSLAQRELIRLATCWRGPLERHDAVVSVEAGFTEREAIELARRAGVANAAYRRPPLWYRFTLAWEAQAPAAP